MRLRPAINTQLADADAERARQNHDDRITELQGLLAAGMAVLEDIELADGIETPIAHKLGRKLRWHGLSSPIGAVSTGRIEEVRSGSYDRSKVLVLKATGWGATIRVTAAVM